MGNNCQSERQLTGQPDVFYPDELRNRQVQPNPDSPSHLNIGPALVATQNKQEQLSIQEIERAPGGGSNEWNSYSQVYDELEHYTQSEYQDLPPGSERPIRTQCQELLRLPNEMDTVETVETTEGGVDLSEVGLTWARYPITASGEDFMKCTLAVDGDSGLLYVVAINADLMSSEPERQKLQVGDRLIMANGSRVVSLEAVEAFLAANRDQQIEFVFAKAETINNHSQSGEGTPDGGARSLSKGEWTDSPPSKNCIGTPVKKKRTPDQKWGEAGNTPVKANGEDDEEGKSGEADPEDYKFSDSRPRRNLFQISSGPLRKPSSDLGKIGRHRSYPVQYPAQKQSFYQETTLFGTLSSSSLRNARDNFLC